SAAELNPVAVEYDPSVRPGTDPWTSKALGATIRFASREALAQAGVQTEAVRERPMPAAVTANATLEYEPQRVARAGPRAAGSVWRLFKGHGDRVLAGDLVALVDAAEGGRVKAEYLQALGQLQS